MLYFIYINILRWFLTYMKTFSLLAALFLIVGCTNQGSNTFDKQSIDNKTKGLVVVKSTGSLKGSSELLV